MRRASTVIIGILLGALAAGLGIGIFLKKANDDRGRLASQLEMTAREAATAREENQRAVENANKKLLASNAEVAKAQTLIKSLEEERDLLAEATPLTTPAAKLTRGWTEVVGLELGVSLKLPPGSAIESNDSEALTFVKDTAEISSDSRWLSLTVYDPRLEQELLASFATSTPVSYLVDGHILTGVRGILPSDKTVLVLRVRYAGQISHLLWVRQAESDSKATLNLLGTLRFKS